MNIRQENNSPNLIFCIENKDFRDYLSAVSMATKKNAQFLRVENIPRVISENPDATLVLQSDKNEGKFFDIGKKLKGIFFKDLKIIFLSFDYLIKADAIKSFSSFLQAPCTMDAILLEAEKLNESQRTILLIDDSKLVHKNLVEPLRSKGFIVEQAYNGREGVDLAISKTPDLIICDIEMPVMNGFEACSTIRGHETTKDTHIIMSSTLKSADDQKKGFAAGVDEYIPKPVIFEDLLDKIKRTFALQSTLREKILIIDSNGSQADKVANFLSKQGFPTRIAYDIGQAKRLLRKFSSDLIIASTNIKSASIIDVADLCVESFVTSDLSFIALVDQENEADRRMALNAGAKDSISTPLTAEAIAAVVERTLAEIRSTRERNQFQRYVSKASFQSALEKSVLSELSLPPRAESRNAIIFFLDIAQFTGRCERYTPKEIVSQINNLFERITEIIIKNDGDIDKFMGDACMSFWFDEGENGNDLKCIQTILEIQSAITELNRFDEIMKSDPLKVRMGLNSGNVILCDLGASKARVDLSMIGDAVNIAARLETACSHYFVDNLISGSVAKNNRKKFKMRLIDRIRVYGKVESVDVYEVINHAKSDIKEEDKLINLFEKGFEAYTQADFKLGKEFFDKAAKFEIKRGYEMNPSKIYTERCKMLLSSPPKNWDGVWKLESK